ncbi:MAG: type II toxin-antitoxin system HicA family toxin [Ignavibacteria bacterium]|nr:type II toxin-antitoxin system HicA family toxin [Ignavibacteria bacterium]
MPKVPVLKPKEVIRVLKKLGFEEERSKGSHVQFYKGKTRVTISVHNKDLRIGTLLNIIRQSGLTIEEFIKLI